MATKHIFISGKVQGVGFRFQATELALQLGLEGWVQNLDDGRVEVVVRGEDAKVQSMLTWLEEGPERAEVENLEIKDSVEDVEDGHFFIKRSMD